MTEEEILRGEEKKKPISLSNPLVQITIILTSLCLCVLISAIISFIVVKKYKLTILVVDPLKERKFIPVEKPLNISNMGDFLVKLTDPDIPRYLKIKELSLAYNGKKYKHLAPEIEERKLQIKSLINDILLKQSSEVATAEGKKVLRKELIREINKIINPKKGRIADVYMEVIIQ